MVADQQAQSVAYRLDDSMTWTTYDAGNPVILDPPAKYANQIVEFRNLGAFWHEPTGKWVPVVALSKAHKLLVYTSDNLREWEHVSEFRPENYVDGVWECPSLYPLPLDGDGETKWIAQV